MYNIPDSDIDETPLTILVKCTQCGKKEEEHICMEDLSDYIPHEENGQIVYTTLIGECATCLGA